ncbi:MAG: metallophosphoesterase [Spirulina sp. SIO3F2]|nr:metallophosphoesterase [Spirulina sp. SIO3F2]
MKRRKFFRYVWGLGGLFFAACARPPRPASSESAVGLDIRNFSADDLRLPEGDPLLRFVSIADTGTGATGQYAVAEAMTAYHQQHAYPLVVMAGDNIYNNGEIRKIGSVFEQPYQALRDRGVQFHAVLGNHDIRTANGNPQVAYPEFHMAGQRYYTFTEGPIQFFALDTNSNADWERQLPWFAQELADSQAPWKVVFGHHQIYASGVYGVNEAQWAVRLKELFNAHQVPLYINGHEHHYERTHAIAGTTYLICGGGSMTRPVGRSPWTAYSASQLSFAAYDVFDDLMVVRGIDPGGHVFDQGVIPRPV